MNSEGTITASQVGMVSWNRPMMTSMTKTAPKPMAEALRKPSTRPMTGEENPPMMPNTLNTSVPSMA
ncbi:hypothetical protein D3C80_2150380 [compost metagenome]